jgi:hypothetical protein
MICAKCMKAGDNNARNRTKTAKKLHDQCTGKGQCDCQHMTGRHHVRRVNE